MIQMPNKRLSCLIQGNLFFNNAKALSIVVCVEEECIKLYFFEHLSNSRYLYMALPTVKVGTPHPKECENHREVAIGRLVTC